jgi:hypothetical protein
MKNNANSGAGKCAYDLVEESRWGCWHGLIVPFQTSTASAGDSDCTGCPDDDYQFWDPPLEMPARMCAKGDAHKNKYKILPGS